MRNVAGRRRGDARWTAFGVCTAVAVLTILDLAKVNVTLEPIRHTLGAGASDVQLIVAGYVLAFGIALVPAGRLGDVWRRKALFLIGLAAFIGASLVCSLAPTTLVLVAGRFLQGIAAGILMPQVLGLVQQLFIGQERGRAFGIFGAAIGLGTAFAPTIGGMLIAAFGEELGWRATFGMNVPLALVLFAFAAWLIPGRQERASGQQLDLVGTGLLAVAVLLVMLPFVLTTGEGDDPARWWLLAPAAALLIAFWWWERRYVRAGKTPVVDFHLFRTPSYRYGVIIITLLFAAMPPTFLLMTLYLMQGLGHDAVTAGLVSVPYALVSAVAAAALGRFSHRWGAQLVMWGLVAFTAGIAGIFVATQFASRDDMPLAIAIPFAVSGFGAGVVMGANQSRMLKHVPITQAGVAGSFSQVGQRLGNAIGVAVVLSVYLSSLAHRPVGDEAAARGAVASAMWLILAVLVATIAVAIVDHFTSIRRRGIDTRAIELVHARELAEREFGPGALGGSETSGPDAAGGGGAGERA